MKLLQYIFVLTVIVCCFSIENAQTQNSSSNQPASAAKSADKYIPVTEYDIKRNPVDDLKLAIAEAKRTKKNILLEIGGKWCIWCRIMDKYFDANKDLLKLRDENYITMKVNFSPENENTKFLSQYPEISGYPHIFVLDSKGKLLHSQDTGKLEEGNSYNLAKFTEFLNAWKPTK